ncbi:MAG: hypothetical protein JSS66_13930 [Armatimonadetes bacterium]|nr:hypothetical protein [Armatimonadota bacterium]
MSLTLSFGRSSVVACLVAFVALASAQSGTIPAAKTFRTAPGVRMNTSSFFPQIDNTISPMKMGSPNESRRTNRTGTANNLGFGGIGNSASTDLGPKFKGIEYTGYFPPDCHMAVSKTHIVQVVNTTIAFYTKSGTLQFKSNMGPNGFFSGTGAFPDQSDPKVFFDPISQRFFVLILDITFGTSVTGVSDSYMLIAVSDDGDPNGNWTKYRVHSTVDRSGNLFWSDYPSYGFNKDAVVVTGNMFPITQNAGVFASAWVLKKSEMLAGSALNVTQFNDDASFTIQACESYDSSQANVYGMEAHTNSSLRIFAWSNLTTTPTMSFKDVTIPSYNFAPGRVQAGSTSIDTLADRILNSTYRAGSIYGAHSIATDDNKAQVAWYEIKVNSWPTSGSPTLRQAGRVRIAGQATFMPGINVNSLKDVSILFTRCSSAIPADVMICSRTNSDSLGFMSVPKQIATSTVSAPPVFRWGDYFKVVVDPSDDLTFWGVGEYNRPDTLWTTIVQNWKVSTGGSGGAQDVLPNSVSTLEGTFAAGNLAAVQTNNGVTYDTDTVKKTDGSYATAIQTTHTITQNRLSVASIVVNWKTFVAPSRTPTGYIFLWNWDTSRWDMIKSYTISGSNTTYSGSAIGIGTRYVSTSKQVKVMVRGLDPIRKNGVPPAPFKLRTDSIRIQIVEK